MESSVAQITLGRKGAPSTRGRGAMERSTINDFEAGNNNEVWARALWRPRPANESGWALQIRVRPMGIQ